MSAAAGPTSARSFPLWFGVLAPPLAWASHLLLGDGLYELGCSPGFARPRVYGLPFDFWAILMTALFLGVDVLAGLLAFRALRAVRQEREAAGAGVGQAPAGLLPAAEVRETVRGRAQAMAVAGIASAFLYGLLLVYGLLPPFFFRTCSISI